MKNINSTPMVGGFENSITICQKRQHAVTHKKAALRIGGKQVTGVVGWYACDIGHLLRDLKTVTKCRTEDGDEPCIISM